MPYSYRRLLGKIVEHFGTQAKFATALGLSEHTVSCKLNGKIEWKQNEMLKSASLLHFDVTEIPAYFFTTEVQD